MGMRAPAERGEMIVDGGADRGTVAVEFFGVARLRAGVDRVEVAAGTLGEVLRRVEASCPKMHGQLVVDGELAHGLLASLGGGQFIRKSEEILPSGITVLLIPADVGG
jgi:molybdopterin converting factor small subunit